MKRVIINYGFIICHFINLISLFTDCNFSVFFLFIMYLKREHYFERNSFKKAITSYLAFLQATGEGDKSICLLLGRAE